MPEIPWYEYLKAGIKMGLKPAEFWELSFLEYWALYNVHFGNVEVPMGRDELEEMMKRIPD